MNFTVMVHEGNPVELKVPEQDVDKLKSRGWKIKKDVDASGKAPDTPDKTPDAQDTKPDTPDKAHAEEPKENKSKNGKK